MVAEQKSGSFAALDGAQFAALTTFRKNGVGVSTPIWFADKAGTIYIQTATQSGKVKRIRHTERVTLVRCNARGQVSGPVLEGRARIVEDAQEVLVARDTLGHKYGMRSKIFYAVMGLASKIRRKPQAEIVYLAVVAS